MLYWSAVFFIIALISGMLGFGGLAVTSASLAQIFFLIFTIGFIASIVLYFAKAVDEKTNL